MKPASLCLKGVVVIFCFLLLPSCAHYYVNQKIDEIPADLTSKHLIENSPARSSDIAFTIAFSGGGTRAAALAYGVLEYLEKIKLPSPSKDSSQTLLDEVDFITSVSGGSFVSAYYGLYGKEVFFEEFEKDFLQRNISRGLFYRILNPINWIRFFSPYYGRSDMAANYYDKILFQKKTFGDFLPIEKGPVINLQATDIVEGNRFAFSPDQFALICSDWDAYPISRGVTSSSAFPGAFSALTLKNYAGGCGFKEEPWISEALKNRKNPTRGFQAALRIHAYLDSEKKKYIHLMDGGISDNLGLRDPLEHALFGRGRALTRKTFPSQTIVIVVNAQTKAKSEWNLLSKTPGLGEVVNAASATMINSYNFETLELLESSLKNVTQKAQKVSKKPIHYHIIQVSFEALEDPEDRAYFTAIPTALSLPEEQVKRLREVAGKILNDSEKFQKLVQTLGGKVVED